MKAGKDFEDGRNTRGLLGVFENFCHPSKSVCPTGTSQPSPLNFYNCKLDFVRLSDPTTVSLSPSFIPNLQPSFRSPRWPISLLSGYWHDLGKALSSNVLSTYNRLLENTNANLSRSWLTTKTCVSGPQTPSPVLPACYKCTQQK